MRSKGREESKADEGGQNGTSDTVEKSCSRNAFSLLAEKYNLAKNEKYNLAKKASVACPNWTIHSFNQIILARVCYPSAFNHGKIMIEKAHLVKTETIRGEALRGEGGPHSSSKCSAG